jgi:glycosyltransferase involved in cell wall biosynthesis
MSEQTALVILTYVDRTRPPLVRRRLRRAVTSLGRTSYAGTVIIVDDGSNCERHLRYLGQLERSGGIQVIRRPVNGGISRAKNTCLRALAQQDVDIGFLAEDDIVFHDGWDDAYVRAISGSGIHHFSWYVHQPDDPVVACNGHLVTATSGLLGLLLTCTRDVLTRVGGFKVLPHRYGYEHIHWTYRNILAGLAPCPCDIAGSHRYIGRSSLPSSCDAAEVQAGTALNRSDGYKIDRLFEPFEE